MYIAVYSAMYIVMYTVSNIVMYVFDHVMYIAIYRVCISFFMV